MRQYLNVETLFSYKGDFLEYLQLEDMGVFTTQGYDPGVSEEKLEELRRFGESLKEQRMLIQADAICRAAKKFCI